MGNTEKCQYQQGNAHYRAEASALKDAEESVMREQNVKGKKNSVSH